MITIALVNESTVVSDSDVVKCAAALQKQVTNDFCLVWGIDARVIQVPVGSSLLRGSWQLIILDDSDQAGALGYHDITAAGLPLGKVFARTDRDNGLSWTVTTSHELLEMLADPFVDAVVPVSIGRLTGLMFALEVCDPCEADSQGYLIDTVQVSDFVTPAWFRRGAKPPYDKRGLIAKPLQVLRGGYASYMRFTSLRGWQQINNETQRRHGTS
jgi:hypothetical protein